MSEPTTFNPPPLPDARPSEFVPASPPAAPDSADEDAALYRKTVELLCALEERLAARAAADARPISEETKAQLADHRALLALAEQGAFKDIRHEYVVVYNGELVCHGPDLAQVRQDAVKNHGVPLARLVYRYIY